jgi:tripartite-type tricarboxylate transporter receptor subunit TctC
MKLLRCKFLQFAGTATVALLVMFSGHAASSQTARTIKIVVPLAPSGAADILARLLAEEIGRSQGQKMLIENRPGAGTSIGTEAVSRATPDGNTLLLATTDFVTLPHTRRLNYDTLTNFEPICSLVSAPAVIVVNSGSPFRTLGDLLDTARAKPGNLTLAATGPGGLFQIAFEMLMRAAKVEMTFVPYPGSPPAINALLGGYVTAVLIVYAPVAAQIKAGSLRALANITPMRIEELPELPTVPRPVTETSEQWMAGTAFSRQRRRRRRRFRKSPAGSSPQCRYPRSRQSWPSRGSIRLGYAARLSVRFFVSNTTTTGQSFARQTSRVSEARRQVWVKTSRRASWPWRQVLPNNRPPRRAALASDSGHKLHRPSGHKAGGRRGHCLHRHHSTKALNF